jgi:hypothetical protein
MTDETPNKPKESKPLFIAPVDMRAGDEITLLFGRPILIKRDGAEIWRDPDIPDYLLETLITEE